MEDLIDTVFGTLSVFVWEGLEASGALTWVSSFVCDGVISGVGSVVIFLPNIFLLFILLAALEDSGYLARVAVIMDRIMHRLGLHGKSFIPTMLGFGCGILAIMATRTMATERERLLKILLTPFMSCSARLPVYLLLVGIFFVPQVQGLMTATTALITEYYTGASRVKVLGYQSAVMGLGILVLETCGGSLAEMSWWEPFLIYLVGFVILIGVIFAGRAA